MRGDFRIDQWLVQPQLNTVHSPANTTIQLEPKVMEVLVHLADHAGEVVSRESLLRALWGDTFVTEHALTRCIAELRRIFQDDAAEPRFIQTITRKGYRLIAQVSMLKAAPSRYEILRKLGQGAVGEVYLARDTELRRNVALKFVLEDRGQDDTGRRRLLREARAAAALDHPFICKIFDTGEASGRTFIAMEYLEGQTLKQQLMQGRFKMEEALPIAAEIAEALQAAHEKGIVHRDLKPSNIMITSQGHVKVMDFGLAKRLNPAEGSVSQEDTLSGLAGYGTTAGTVPYMSPEQLRAEPVDGRTDLFSFGVILYEMLTAVHPFRRKSAMETATAILEETPAPLSRHIGSAPGLLQHIINKLLAKDPGRRYQIIHDVRTDLLYLGPSRAEAGSREESWHAPSHSGWMVWLRRLQLSGLILVTAAVAALISWYAKTTPSIPTAQTIIKLQEGLRLASAGPDWRPRVARMDISRDGRFIVYSAITQDPGPEPQSQLYLRRIDQMEAKPIPGTQGAQFPFLSPDDKWLGFRDRNRLAKVPIEGGTPVFLSEATLVVGASWCADDTIVFSRNGSLYRIPADGGEAIILTSPDQGKGESSHRLPRCLPDGRGILFTVARHSFDMQPRIALLPSGSREWRALLENAADASYAPTGHLIFAREGILMATPFDLNKLELGGRQVPVVPDVLQALNTLNSLDHTGAAQYAFSDSGCLVYASGGIVPDPVNSLVWVDYDGRVQEVVPFRLPFYFNRISPDGTRIVYSTIGRQSNLWLYDIQRQGAPLRLTPDNGMEHPIWTIDGSHVTFTSRESGITNIFQMPVSGSAPRAPLMRSTIGQIPGSWSPDGKVLAFNQVQQHDPRSWWDIYLFYPDSGEVRPFLNSQFNEMSPEFSPDGNWLAYVSNETGRNEVYIKAFPGPGGRVAVSTDGGGSPVWARNQKQLFFTSGNQLWGADVQSGPEFSVGKRRMLFALPGNCFGGQLRSFDLSHDGRRFLMVKREDAGSRPATELVLIQNWFEELLRLCPRGK